MSFIAVSGVVCRLLRNNLGLVMMLKRCSFYLPVVSFPCQVDLGLNAGVHELNNIFSLLVVKMNSLYIWWNVIDRG